MFQRILVANRGEIALRVIRACRDLGIEVVAVFSEADRDAPYLDLADEAICIGPARRRRELPQDRRASSAPPRSPTSRRSIPATASSRRTPHFAEVCRACKIEFIGPPHEAMRRLGNKNEARKLAKKASVPVVPGSEGLITDESEALQLAHEMGYPGAHQGGGRRRRPRHARRPQRHQPAVRPQRPPSRKPRTPSRTAASTSRSTSSSRATSRCRSSPTGTATSSTSGSAIARCSAAIRSSSRNRRPRTCPTNVREEICDAAVRLVKAAGYYNAGTCEFLVDKDNNFYFIEVNARIQVEHPVTELVTGIDLVREQIRIAAGEKLRFKQKDIVQRGVRHRVPHQRRGPGRTTSARRPGTITRWQPPGGPGVRLDTHVCHGLPRAAELRFDGRQAARASADARRGDRVHAAGLGRVRRRGDQDDDPDPPRDLQQLARSSRAGSIRRSSNAPGCSRRVDALPYSLSRDAERRAAATPALRGASRLNEFGFFWHFFLPFRLLVVRSCVSTSCVVRERP